MTCRGKGRDTRHSVLTETETSHPLRWCMDVDRVGRVIRRATRPPFACRTIEGNRSPIREGIEDTNTWTCQSPGVALFLEAQSWSCTRRRLIRSLELEALVSKSIDDDPIEIKIEAWAWITEAQGDKVPEETEAMPLTIEVYIRA